MTFAEAWQLDSGLREHMDLAIHASYFSQHADYLNGVPYLIFFIGEDENGDPVELRMPVGADWSSQDGGRTIVHPTKRFIVKSSIYGHWIEHALALEDRPEGQRLSDLLFARGAPTTADIWTGLRLHLDLFEITFGPKLKPVSRLMPTAFLGMYTDQATVQAPLPQTPTPATVAPTAPSPADVVAQARASQATDNGASPLMQQMIDLAKSSGSHLEFQQKAFAIPEVLADEELAIQVATESGGIWSLAHA